MDMTIDKIKLMVSNLEQIKELTEETKFLNIDVNLDDLLFKLKSNIKTKFGLLY